MLCLRLIQFGFTNYVEGNFLFFYVVEKDVRYYLHAYLHKYGLISFLNNLKLI